MRITAGGGAHEAPRASGPAKAGGATKGGVAVSVSAAPARAAAKAPPGVRASTARAKGELRALVASGAAAKAAGTPAKHRPIVAVHRGMTDTLDDAALKKHRDVGNDLRSFKAAIDAGADAIELDVRRTKDGKLVVYHDERLFHDPWSARDPLRFRNRKVSEVDYKDLPRLSNGEKIPTLDEAIALAKKRGVQMQVEVKDKGDGPALAIAKKLDEALPRDRFIITSFERKSIARIEEKHPEIATSLWFTKKRLETYASKGEPTMKGGKPDPRWIIDQARKTGADSVSVGWGIAKDAEFRRLATEAGVEVYVGDVNSKKTIAAAANDPFIAGVVTEEPQDVLEAQHRAPPKKKGGK